MTIPSHLITHLPYLAEVARTGSFTKAAEALHLTQAAVSYQIKQLEQKTDCRLILRQAGSQLRLSSAGENLVREYNYCEKRLGLALQQLNHQQFHGELRITTPVDFGSLLMPKVMAQLKTMAPQLRINLHTSDKVIDLSASRWEMAIRANDITDVINPSPLLITTGMMVASQAYLQSNGTPKTLQQLSKHTLLIRQESKNSAWLRLLKGSKVSFSDLSIKATLGNSFAIREAVKEGLGIALLPEFLIKNELKSGELQTLMPTKTKQITGEFYIARIDAPQLASYEALLRQAFLDINGT